MLSDAAVARRLDETGADYCLRPARAELANLQRRRLLCQAGDLVDLELPNRGVVLARIRVLVLGDVLTARLDAAVGHLRVLARLLLEYLHLATYAAGERRRQVPNE